LRWKSTLVARSFGVLKFIGMFTVKSACIA
jgi:hypothetical protein